MKNAFKSYLHIYIYNIIRKKYSKHDLKFYCILYIRYFRYFHTGDNSTSVNFPKVR